MQCEHFPGWWWTGLPLSEEHMCSVQKAPGEGGNGAAEMQPHFHSNPLPRHSQLQTR